MSKYPEEIDELMWTLAESDDDAAIEEFGERYPNFRSELAQRMQMVRGLRGSRPKAEPVKHKAKRFTPTAPENKVSVPSRWTMTAAAVFVLASLCFATYAVTNYYNQANRKPDVVVNNNLPPDSTPQDPVTENNLPDNQPEATPNKGYGNQESITSEPYVEPFDRPVTLVATRITLANALNLIASQIGVTLTSAPGMPDIEIAADYRNVTARHVLEDLGKNFGFTPMVQSPREALLIPSTDPSGGDSPRPPNGSAADLTLPEMGTSRE